MSTLPFVESEDLSSCRKWDLKNVAPVASSPTFFSHPAPCTTQKKIIDSSLPEPCPVTDIEPSKFSFANEDLEHQDVVELKSAFNNLFWGEDTYALSRKQTVSDSNEDCDLQTQISGSAIINAAPDDPTPAGKQCLEQLCVADEVSVWQSSNVGQTPDTDNWADFSEMRLPRCLSPLTSEADETSGISAQDPVRTELEFSSCLSPSHVNIQPTSRFTSSPIQPQALPGKTNQQNPSLSSLQVNELHCSVVGKNPCPLRPNRDQNGEPSECKSEEKKTNLSNFPENGLLKGTEDNIVDRQMNESVVRKISTARDGVEPDNEPYRKKAKVAGYPNGVDTQTLKVVNPCSVKIKNISHIDNIQDISSSVISEKLDCLEVAKSRKTVSIGLKSQENLALRQMNQMFKRKGQEACQKEVWDTKQPSSLVAKHGHGRPLQKGTCAKATMEDLSKLNSSSAVLNTSSSSSRLDLQLTQMSKECVPRHDDARLPKVQHHPSGLAQTIIKVKDLTNEWEKNIVAELEMGNPIVETEKVILDVNLNREEKLPERYSSLAKKTRFCDQIFHQSVFSAGTTVPQDVPVKHHLRSVLQTTDRKIRTSLPPSLSSKKLREPPVPDHMNTRLMTDNSKREKKDTPGGVPMTDKPDYVLDKSKDKKVDSKKRVDCEVKSSSRNVDGRLVNRNFVREAEISASTALSIHESVDLNPASHLCTFPSARDLNSNFGTDNNFCSLIHPFRPENMMEKPTTDEQVPERLCEVPVSNKGKGVRLIKTKELHTESTQIVNLKGQGVWNKEKEKENTGRKLEYVEISRMNEYEVGISDAEVDVMDEYPQLTTGHGDEVAATADDPDIEGIQMAVDLDNDGEDAHEEEFSGPQVLRTEVEVMPSDEGNFEFLIY